MSDYSELVKNIEGLRAYMRDFYLFGFKSREEYDRKSARSYDNERRRIDSLLSEYMGFTRMPYGKNVFLSIDSRVTAHNPLFKAWKAKSFTNGDITLHFLLFDILYDDTVALSVREIAAEVDRRLSPFPEPLLFDESTIRKKLKEYEDAGLLTREKAGKQLVYRRTPDTDVTPYADALAYFSEVAPCGVVGSFLCDQCGVQPAPFTYKHHYIAPSLDSDVLCALFSAMHEHRTVRAFFYRRKSGNTTRVTFLPLRIYISVQTGRQHVIGIDRDSRDLHAYRVDYLSVIEPLDVSPDFDASRAALDEAARYMWGVNGSICRTRRESVSFIVTVEPGEDYIVGRLMREKRCGKVEKLDDRHYRFTAEVWDTSEMLPFIRTFISRLTQLDFSDRRMENAFRADIREMYAMYGIGEATK